MFLLGLVGSIGTLALAIQGGGLVIIAYGAVIVGAGMWMESFSKLKKYVDRPIPKYRPPRNSAVHDPGEY